MLSVAGPEIFNRQGKFVVDGSIDSNCMLLFFKDTDGPMISVIPVFPSDEAKSCQ